MDKLTQSLKIDKSATCAFSDCISVKDFRRACDGCLIRPVANRLSEYEDTGLTPNEVEHICITLRNNGYKHINHMLMTISKLLTERNGLREELKRATDALEKIGFNAYAINTIVGEWRESERSVKTNETNP